MKKSELRKIIKEELDETFKGKEFPLDKEINRKTNKLFNNLYTDIKKMTSNDDNRDYVLASLYNMIEGVLDSSANAQYWRRMK